MRVREVTGPDFQRPAVIFPGNAHREIDDVVGPLFQTIVRLGRVSAAMLIGDVDACGAEACFERIVGACAERDICCEGKSVALGRPGRQRVGPVGIRRPNDSAREGGEAVVQKFCSSCQNQFANGPQFDIDICAVDA